MFCNPPYGRGMYEWIKKADYEIHHGCELVVLLIPARTDTKWFHEFIYKKHEVRFVKGRIKFCIDGIQMDNSTFPSMIVIMNAQHKE